MLVRMAEMGVVVAAEVVRVGGSRGGVVAAAGLVSSRALGPGL